MSRVEGFPRPATGTTADQNPLASETLATVPTYFVDPSTAPADPTRLRFKGFSLDHEEKLVISGQFPPPVRETYRRLGAALHHAQGETGLKSLMITSAVPDEGKTLTAINVALTLSESYQRRVLLIDADLRRPSLGEICNLTTVYGLRELLTDGPQRKAPLIQLRRTLWALPAGAPDQDPTSKLTSGHMKALIREAVSIFDWVIVDTPPVGIITDAKLLAANVDAALLVVRARKTPAALVQEAVNALGRDRILGVVLNRTDIRDAPGSNKYYQSYYYGSNSKKK